MGKIRMPSTARIDVCKYSINQDLGVPSPIGSRSPSEKHGWRVFGGMMGPGQ